MIAKKIKSKELQEKLEELDRILLAFNALGTLNMPEYNILLSYLKGSFGYEELEDI